MTAALLKLQKWTHSFSSRHRYPPSDDGGPIEAQCPAASSKMRLSYPPSDDGGPIEARSGPGLKNTGCTSIRRLMTAALLKPGRDSLQMHLHVLLSAV